MTILVTSLIGESQTLDSVALGAFASQIRAGSADDLSTDLQTAVDAKKIQAVDFTVDAGEVVAAAKTLTEADSGKTIFLNSATEFAVTLPLPKLGLQFEFVVKAAPSGADYTVVTNGGSNIIKGAVMSADLNAASDGDIETTGGDTISFVSAKAVAGDRVVLRCDGDVWYAHGFASVFDAITITTAA